MKLAKRLSGNRFIKNTGWMMFGSIYQMVLSLFIGLLTARYLGPSNYGIINYVAAFVSFMTPICGLGLSGVAVKRLVDEPEKKETIIGTSIALEFVASVVCSVVIVAIVWVSNIGETEKLIVAFLESFQLIFKSVEPINYWFQAKLLSKYASISSIIGYTVMSAYRVFLLITKKSVLWFAFAMSLEIGIISIFYIIFYKKLDGTKLKLDLKYGKSLLSDSYHFILSGLMVVIYSQMDKIMIESMVNDSAVGLYTAASTITSLWFLIPTALITSARPLIMQYKAQNEGLYLRRLKQLYASIFWMGIIVSVIFTVFSRFFVSILYGKEYLGAAGVLSISIWYGTFAQLGNARGIWILCEKKNKYTKYYLMWGAIINIVLNWFMIQSNGIEGAAIATLITQICTSLLAPLFYRETRVHTRIVIDSIFLKWK